MHMVASEMDKVAQIHQDIRRIFAEGDLAVVQSLLTFSPRDRGIAAVDILRFEDGKIVEHWDVQQPVPETSLNNNPMV
jgi:predicted SnoaL-like aldol condensation-catalyzing enzyme